MTTKREWRHADAKRGEWGTGPWDNEPDKIQWVDEASNLDCLMHRNRLGAWCGYVGVAEGHPYFGKEYDACDVSAHGGLTYADFCQDTTDESRGICHVPEPGRPHRVWWLGFDCAHAGDLVPGMKKYGSSFSGDYYKSREYVEREVIGLAAQLSAITEAP